MPCPSCGRLSAAHVHENQPPPPRLVRPVYPTFMFLTGAGLGFTVGIIVSFLGA